MELFNGPQTLGYSLWKIDLLVRPLRRLFQSLLQNAM